MSPFKLLAVSALACAGAAQALTLPPLPVARDDFYLLDSLTLNIAAPGLLENDSGTQILVSGFYNPSAGTLDQVITNGAFTYRPDQGFDGVATFQYLILDQYNRSAMATVHIDASRSVPVAQNDYYTATAATFSLSAPGMLRNDRGGIGALTVTAFAHPSAGTVDRVVTDGSFQYTAPRGFDGVASFDYILVDELGRNARATVAIDYGASIPVAFDDVYTMDPGGLLSISAPGLLANDAGGLGTVTLANYSNPTAGTIERVITDGSFVYRAAPDFNGVATFRYFSVDELGRYSDATVTINVGVVPEPAAWLLLLGGLPLLARRAARATSAPSRR